jgi:hypothetical protein
VNRSGRWVKRIDRMGGEPAEQSRVAVLICRMKSASKRGHIRVGRNAGFRQQCAGFKGCCAIADEAMHQCSPAVVNAGMLMLPVMQCSCRCTSSTASPGLIITFRSSLR